MVGVGGRSKACAACRRRRVKCDERKPKCLRCVKGNYDCGGYREMRFIQFGEALSQPENAAASSTDSNNAGDQALALRQASDTTSKHQVHSLSLSLCPIPSISSFQDDICVTYTLTHLLNGASYDGKTRAPSHHWSDEPLANTCFLSLATTYFGSQHREERLVKKGLQLYGVALRELHTALADAHQCQTRNVLDSVVTLNFLEFLISDNPDGWLGHSSGLERLFELRGPESFQTTPERLILEQSRPGIIFASLALRKSTILSSPEWKMVPWAVHQEKKSSMQFLVDILADCPYLYMVKEEITSSGGILLELSAAQHIVNKVSEILKKLESWKIQWDSEHGNACFEVAAPQTGPVYHNPDGETMSVWSTILHYESLSAANETTLYNAILILLLKLAQDLLLFTDDPNFGGDLIASRMYAAGIEICRSVEYHLLHYQVGVGSFYVLFPLRMAWQAVGRSNSCIGLWLEHLLQRIAFGVPVGNCTVAGKWAVASYLLKDFANIKGTEGF
ncbi:uncharacterized protein BDZ99DRAFT_382807 [Mytilinidion resinicola]|uniref:Zn(2)-C6 fungal-type domain-containing protein n=1 Tax=Mytilinidion resinicola TaxID=574789 RepID=A0A6A6YUD9_9PEZI|nr:uncharacterized protein BDZ99DRAFT_382807 [Mytilinidion resinicola]KAF2812158.1 hypothetical protein BDZ99DRAFT_382807 [Mytilinidion resinicola]